MDATEEKLRESEKSATTTAKQQQKKMNMQILKIETENGGIKLSDSIYIDRQFRIFIFLFFYVAAI